jgi:hypothetical protein
MKGGSVLLLFTVRLYEPYRLSVLWAEMLDRDVALTLRSHARRVV